VRLVKFGEASLPLLQRIAPSGKCASRWLPPSGRSPPDNRQHSLHRRPPADAHVALPEAHLLLQTLCRKQRSLPSASSKPDPSKAVALRRCKTWRSKRVRQPNRSHLPRPGLWPSGSCGQPFEGGLPAAVSNQNPFTSNIEQERRLVAAKPFFRNVYTRDHNVMLQGQTGA